MLDLKKLRKEIEEALEKETEESLTTWLLNKRSSNVESYIGDGIFMPCDFKSLHESVQISIISTTIVLDESFTEEYNNYPSNTHYNMAA